MKTCNRLRAAGITIVLELVLPHYICDDTSDPKPTIRGPLLRMLVAESRNHGFHLATFPLEPCYDRFLSGGNHRPPP